MLGRALIAAILIAAPAIPSAAKPPRITNAYTKPYDHCRVIKAEKDVEGVEMWSLSRCKGYVGIPLFLSSDDARDFLYPGADFEGHGVEGPLHAIGGPIEWRLADGKPFAIIFRVTTAPQNGPWSRLIVETIGQPDKPGCPIAKFDALKPGANVAARGAADAVLSGKAHCIELSE